MQDCRTLIIAEAGVNHNGNLAMAKELVEVAASAGANLVKFQTFSADRLVTASAPKAEYAKAKNADESQHAMIRKLELSPEMHDELIVHCTEKGIGFCSTGFDIPSLDLLVELGMKFFKIPSGEITNLPYLRHVGAFGKPIILSTGMSTMAEIERALDVLEKAGAPRQEITILHCNTEYPTPMEDVNLRAMLSIKEEFGVKVGYSDHTAGIEVSIAAVALGATVIEKHFTLDRSLEGPDHAASLEPDELSAMVNAIRSIEKALGDGVKKPSPSEAKNTSVVRKSLVAALPITKGEVFSKKNLAAKRPGSGISPMLWDDVIGQEAPCDFEPDELISL
jgi:N,N'-diacetyllegionaminate synthase